MSRDKSTINKMASARATAGNSYCAWTREKDEQLVNLVDGGFSDFEIAKILGRSLRSIWGRKGELGVTRKMVGEYDHKKIFGAGFHAGVKASEKKVDNMALTSSMAKSVVDRQTGIAKKVYECVPINEAFDAKRICSEMARMGSSPDIHIVSGCLKTLKEAGLVVEVLRGTFQRAKVKADAEKPAKPELKQVSPTPAQDQQEIGPIDKLAAVASCMRDVSASLQRMAKDVEDAALQMSEAATENSGEVQKLRQLAELIKTL